MNEKDVLYFAGTLLFLSNFLRYLAIRSLSHVDRLRIRRSRDRMVTCIVK